MTIISATIYPNLAYVRSYDIFQLCMQLYKFLLVLYMSERLSGAHWHRVEF